MNVVEDEETALEVVHDCFIVLYPQWKRLGLGALSPESLESHLIEVVEDTALQAIQQQHQRPVPSGLELYQPVECTEMLAFTNFSSVIVVGELARLPRRQQEVLALTIDGYASVEIASTLGIEANAVRVHLHLARVKIRAWLESAGILAA
jgi:DNA-directed RNA polymerase specialized sigma24 family protein